MRKRMKFFAIDLFCGAGGATRGLIDAGGYVIAGVDNDASCEKSYVKNNKNRFGDRKAPKFLKYDIFPKSRQHPGGEQRFLLQELDALIGAQREQKPDMPLLLTCCAPCQPFTKISKAEITKERQDKRSRDQSLLLETVRLIRRYQPEMILAENVEGITSAKYGDVWKRFERSLKRAGYVLGWKVVCASDFGVPQYRKRTVLLAVHKSHEKEEGLFELFGNKVAVPSYDPNAKLTTVSEAIGHLPALEAGGAHPEIPNHRCRNLSDLNRKRLAASVPGKSNTHLKSVGDEDLTLDCHRKGAEKHGTNIFTDVYTRMAPDRPSPTITTRCNSISNGRFGHFDTGQVRAISVREAAILQSFPEDYVLFPINETEGPARQVGNAFPPLMSQFFAEYLVDTYSV